MVFAWTNDQSRLDFTWTDRMLCEFIIENKKDDVFLFFRHSVMMLKLGMEFTDRDFPAPLI